ncbi:MAG: hypothetical protein JNM17_19025 [Archangium sp.]|nr:hypothetical protein [Archangium sp.]
MLIFGLSVGLVSRLIFAFSDDGLWWPDEYYQALEPAHRAVFGYGWQAWEFIDGARNWTLPGIVALVLKFANALRLPLIPSVEVFCVLINVSTIIAVYVLSKSLGASRWASSLAATVFSFMGLAVFMSPRTMGEGWSALPVTLAFALLFRRETRGLIIAGLLLSLAVALRLQNGLFCLGALVIAFRHARREGLVLLGVLGVGALIYGLIDLFTWGSFFHSAITYIRFNLIEGRASSFGTHPFWLYVTSLITSEGATVIPLVLLSLIAMRRSREVPLMIITFLVVHSLIPHKELRFVFPVLPLLAAHAAMGLDLVKPQVQGAVVTLALLSLASLPWLTYGRLGISDPPRDLPALDHGGPYNRLLQKAGQLDDLCGLRINGFVHWRTGGYAYFHKNAPLYRAEKPAEGEGHFNYVIAPKGSIAGMEIATDRDVSLIKLDVPCTPDPAYDWRLE